MAETTHREWFWAGIGIIVTTLALVFWGALFLLAAGCFAVWVFKAPWFEKQSPSVRVLRKCLLLASISVSLWLVWWYVPPPNLLGPVQEILNRTPNGTPSGTPTAANTPAVPSASPTTAYLPTPIPKQSVKESGSTSPVSKPSFDSNKYGNLPNNDAALEVSIINVSVGVEQFRAHIVAQSHYDNRTYAGDTASDGSLTIRLPSGMYDVTVTAPGYRRYRDTVFTSHAKAKFMAVFLYKE